MCNFQYTVMSVIFMNLKFASLSKTQKSKYFEIFKPLKINMFSKFILSEYCSSMKLVFSERFLVILGFLLNSTEKTDLLLKSSGRVF